MTFSPAPVPLAEVMSPEWLSWALSRKGKRIEVAQTTMVEKLGPTATKVRLTVEFASPPPEGTPSALCIKGFFDDYDSPYMKTGMQGTEALFYRDIVPGLTVRVPQCLYSDADDSTGNGVTVMEDLKVRGTRFLTALSPYSPEQAAQSLDQLARLHAGSWGGRNADKFPFVSSKLDFLYKRRMVPPERVTELLLGERGDKLPSAVRDGQRVYEAIARLAERAGPSDCFIHGDCHGGNVYEAPEGAGLIDWQLLQRGEWSLDVAYHIGAALTVEDRRRMEQDLLRHYLERLGAHGVTPPTWEDAWLAYRRSIAYGYFLWAITVRVDPPITEQFVTRLGQSLADHQGFELLGV